MEALFTTTGTFDVSVTFCGVCFRFALVAAAVCTRFGKSSQRDRFGRWDSGLLSGWSWFQLEIAWTLWVRVRAFSSRDVQQRAWVVLRQNRSIYPPRLFLPLQHRRTPSVSPRSTFNFTFNFFCVSGWAVRLTCPPPAPRRTSHVAPAPAPPLYPHAFAFRRLALVATYQHTTTPKYPSNRKNTNPKTRNTKHTTQCTVVAFDPTLTGRDASLRGGPTGNEGAARVAGPYEFTVRVKYVRREIRSLTDMDREMFFNAVSVMQRVPSGVGQLVYGSQYYSKDYLTRLHLYYGECHGDGGGGVFFFSSSFSSCCERVRARAAPA